MGLLKSRGNFSLSLEILFCNYPILFSIVNYALQFSNDSFHCYHFAHMIVSMWFPAVKNDSCGALAGACAHGVAFKTWNQPGEQSDKVLQTT